MLSNQSYRGSSAYKTCNITGIRGPRAAIPARRRCVACAAVATPPLSDAAPIAPGSASSASADGASSPVEPFSWTKQWWPVLPISYLDAARPNGPIEILGHSYVVWFDARSQRWRCFDDACPHRLARLSHGRLTQDGALQCSYHGWEFQGGGSCSRIPQIADPKAAAAAAASQRSCVRSYTTAEAGGLLFAWLEAGPAAEAEAAAAPPPRVAGGNEAAEWSAALAPNDAQFWLEQGMDPAHANFLHHRQLIFDMSHHQPMDAEVVHDVTPGGGFVWRHGAYSTAGAGSNAQRAFSPPASNVSSYEVRLEGGGRLPVQVQTFVVPVRPGVCRTFFKFGGFKPKGPLQSVWSRLVPSELLHAIANDPSIYDQDVIIMESQQCNIRSPSTAAQSPSPPLPDGGEVDPSEPQQLYSNFSRADEGVRAMGEWLKGAGYRDMWRLRVGRQAASAPWQPWPLERLLDRRERHVDSCALCRKAEGHVARAARALAAAAWALGAAAAGAVAAAAGIVASAALAGAAALPKAALVAAAVAAAAAACSAACTVLRGRLLEWAEYNFVSGVRRWKAKGGLSLVPAHGLIRL